MADKLQPTWTLTARWLFPIEGVPLERGTITVRGERILSVEPHRSRTADFDLGNVAILPGLVNAHTHLDLSGLRGRVPPTEDFTAWLLAVIQHRRSLSPSQVETDIATGLAEALAHGTTLLGDISAQGLSWPALAAAPVRAVVFHELLGLPSVRAHQAWAAACAWLHDHPATPTCRPGLSPHAPYSVRSTLFQAAAHLSQAQPIPLTIHLAEARAEWELLERQAGPFVAFLSQLGVWDPLGLVPDAEATLRLNAKSASVLFAHGNYLHPHAAVPRGGTIVYCPRTHAAFGHKPHPFRQFLAAGVRVALGTDSLASNPDLDVLAEARFLHRLYPDVPGDVLLRMATLSGAEALGWQKEAGSLAAGKSADLVIVPLPTEEGKDPHLLLLNSTLPVRSMLWRGEWQTRESHS
jgi:cytosine/adenosine deaminase-related metal-dependent hydrolase